MQQIKIVSESDGNKFESEVNYLLKNEGYKILTSSCGFVQSEEYNFCDSYQIILVKEE